MGNNFRKIWTWLVTQWRKCWARLRRTRNWTWEHKFFVSVIVALVIITASHVWLVIDECRLGGACCQYLFGKLLPPWYRVALLHAPWIAAVILIGWLVRLRATRQAHRQRFTGSFVAVVAIALGYMAAYHWEGLRGEESPSAVLSNIGLAVVGVSGVLFVVWQARIASENNQIAADKSLAEQFMQASEMLYSDHVGTRLSGIAVIRSLGRKNETYRKMSVRLLRTFATDSTRVQGEDTDVAQTTLLYLSNRRPRRRVRR